MAFDVNRDIQMFAVDRFEPCTVRTLAHTFSCWFDRHFPVELSVRESMVICLNLYFWAYIWYRYIPSVML